MKDGAVKLRRQAKLAQRQADGSIYTVSASDLQDYLIVPGQQYIDDIAD